MRKLIVAAAVSVAGFAGCDKWAKDAEILIVLPSATFVATSVFVAEELGLFEREGVAVTVRTLSGAAAIAAVISGDADFTVGSGPTLLRTSGGDQSVLAIANLIDRPMVELVLRKDVAERLHVSATQSLSERGRKLKGLTIAVHGIGTMVHAWVEYVVRAGGLAVGSDVQLIPMEPGAMGAALSRRLVDGYATSPPFSTLAETAGDVVMLASGSHDAPDLVPFPYGLVLTRRDTCERIPNECTQLVRALAAASRTIRQDSSDIVRSVLRHRFPGVDEALLARAWSGVRDSFTLDLQVTDTHLRNAESLMLSGDVVKTNGVSHERLYTSRFVR